MKRGEENRRRGGGEDEGAERRKEMMKIIEHRKHKQNSVASGKSAFLHVANSKILRFLLKRG